MPAGRLSARLMTELTEFPYLPSGDPQRAVLSLVTMCRQMPPSGEQFRFFRKRMKQYRLWDEERLPGTLRFLGLQRAGQMRRSRNVKDLADAKNDNQARAVLTQQLWNANPLLFKTVLELLKERVHSRDDIIKHIGSFAYRGKKPGRPQLEGWLHMALGLDILKMVGIAFDLGARGHAYLELASKLDVEEFLDDVAAAESESESGDPGPLMADVSDDEEGASDDPDDDPEGNPEGNPEGDPDVSPESEEESDGGGSADHGAASRGARSASSSGGRAGSPASSRSGATSRLVALDVTAMESPLGQGAPVAISRFAGQTTFSDDVLDETASRIQTWWSEQSAERAGAAVSDFGFEPEAWMENAEETLYRIAVAAALVFRLGRDRDVVQEIFGALDDASVLGDLYYGTAPDELPENLDPRALMLASLIARRCAETPDLAATLEKQDSAGDAFSRLQDALGRGLLEIELFWMMGALAELGALRFEDMANYTALPRRAVRDTLFRLGFVASPYAHDARSLAGPAAAARRVAGTTTSPPDEVIMSFALAAGCAYDCGNRRQCQYACRERAG